MTGRFCLALLLASSAWLTVAGEGFFLGHFQAEVEEALVRLRGILEEERRPRFPADVPHRYEDKFLLSELSTQAAMLSLVELLSATTAWNRDAGGAMLDFKSCSSCSFLKTEETDVQVGPSQVQETESMLGNWRSTVKTTTKVKHHVWNTSVEWSINLGDPILDGRAGEELRSKTEHPSEVAPPEPPVPSRCKTRQLDVRWLRRRLSDEVLFAVNRSSPACRTPSVNEETQAALDFFGQLQVFADQSNQYLRKQLPQGQRRIYQELQGNLFKPVLSLFAMDNASSQLVLKADLPLVVELYRKSLAERLEEQQRTVGDKAQNSLLRAALLFQEMSSLAQQMIQAVQALEGLLHQQLSNALGKTLRSADFSEYIHFHGRVLLGPSYAPQSFVYAVRRPEHHPEGTISIDSMDNAIRTFAVHRPDATPVRVQLSSAATITLHGEHFLHAAIFHRFAREPEQALQLVARARQLSSFVLMVGKIVAADQFEPTAALIIQNKDELIIPLLLETVPTPKEFIDAIHSLSPEQQRFARAFRKMQLSSSLFAVAVVQIKPLLEKVLNLPEYSLTKEIQLTQDLIELFVRYQVPPDLMSYEAGSGDKLGRVSPSQKLPEVKQHVKALWDTISASKEKQLKEQQEEAKMRNMQTCGSEECPMPPPRGVRVMASAMEDSSNYMEMGQVKEAELAATSVQLDSNGPKMAKVRPMYMSRQVPQVHTYASSAPRMMKPEVEVAEDAADAADAESFEANLDTAVSAEKPKEPNQEGHEHETSEASEGHLENGSWDYTKIPHQLDANFLKYDTEAKLRPSKIKVGEVWQKQEQLGFLGDQKKRSLKASEQRRETNQAFDLLDALSRSGALPLESSSLHVLVAATHCFDETIIDTAIKQNQNPIEKLERSMMIVASTIYQKPARLLLQPGEVERMRGLSPALFDAAHKVQKLFPR